MFECHYNNIRIALGPILNTVPFLHLFKLITIAPMSSVEMAVEDTMEKEPMGMRTKNNWRKTILEPDDESGAQANAQELYRVKISRH